MKCVCGCDRDVPSALTTVNFLAASIALDLLAWDKHRTLSGNWSEEREDLIARGADCYQWQLMTIHAEDDGGPDDQAERWLEESAACRTAKGLNKRRLFGPAPPNLSADDIARLDPRHPETSFSGRTDGATPATATATAADGGEGTLIADLERLQVLYAQGALSDAEFAAAKTRLLGGG